MVMTIALLCPRAGPHRCLLAHAGPDYRTTPL